MEDHAVWCSVFVRVGDVMDSTDGHHNLTQRVDNGQVDDGPAGRRGQEAIAVVFGPISYN